MTDSNKDDEKKRDLLIFDLIQRRFDRGWQRIRDLDNKAANMIGFVSIALSILLGTGTLTIINNINTVDINIVDLMVFFISAGLLISSIISNMIRFKIRKFTEVPDTAHLIKEYTDEPYKTVIKTNAISAAVKELESELN